MAQSKSLTINFFGRDVTLNKTLDGIKKNTFATSNVLEKSSRKATYVLAGLSAAAIKFAKAAAEDEKGAISLANTLKTVVGASEVQIANVEKFIKKSETFAAVADDKLRPAFDTLVRSTGSVAKSQEMLNVALEIAQKQGVDVGQVTDAMAKASRGQFKALVNLTKIAPKAAGGNKQYSTSLKVVNGQLQTVTKSLGTSKKATESLDDYLKRINGSFKGSIEAVSGTSAFKFQQFQIALENVQETLGSMLLPYMNDLADMLVRIGPWVEKHKDTIGKWAVAIAGMAVSIKALNGAYKAFKITEAIVQFTRLGRAATVAGTEAAAAGRIAAAGWGWVGVTVAAVLALNEFGNYLKNKREAKIKKIEKEGWAGTDLQNLYGITPDRLAATVKPSEIRAVPRMASGGIVTRRTTAIIGEAGPEAVVPLSKGGFGGGVTIINHIAGSVVTEKEISLKIRNDMAQLLRRKGINPAVLGV